MFRFFVQNIENENDDFFDDQIVHFKTLIRKLNRNSDDDKIKTFKKKIRIFFRKTKKTLIFVSNSYVENVFCEKNVFVWIDKNDSFFECFKCVKSDYYCYRNDNKICFYCKKNHVFCEFINIFFRFFLQYFIVYKFSFHFVLSFVLLFFWKKVTKSTRRILTKNATFL